MSFTAASRGALNPMEPGTKHVKKLTIDENNQMQERLSQLIKYEPGSSTRIVLTKQKDWIAVPLAIEEMFTSQTLDSFVKAAESYGRSEVIATWIDHTIDQGSKELNYGYGRDLILPVSYSVPAVLEGVRELYLGSDLTFLDCAVFAGNPDWVYIRMMDFVQIIYGPEAITRMFLNTGVDEAFEAFRTWFLPLSQEVQAPSQELQALSQAFVQDVQTFSDTVYRNLRTFNAAPPGTEVTVC
jgi:hypothetical protein